MITSVYIDTDELVFQLHSVSDDAQKALEWVRSFRDTLMFGARIPNPLPFAMECMAMSEGFSASGVLGKLRAAARKRLSDEGIETTPESVDAEIARTQGADAVREIMAKIERANSLKAEIRRRKFTAAAATSDGVDVVPDRESGSLERTTGCNHYDQEANQASTETIDKAGAGEVTPEKSVSAHSPALPVHAKDSFGEFGNVKLTSDEYAKLLTRVDNAQALIEELDQYIESQGKGKKYKSHYATLLNWSRRKATEEKQPSRYKNINDINRENCEQIERDLRAMFHPEEVI